MLLHVLCHLLLLCGEVGQEVPRQACLRGWPTGLLRGDDLHGFDPDQVGSPLLLMVGRNHVLNAIHHALHHCRPLPRDKHVLGRSKTGGDSSGNGNRRWNRQQHGLSSPIHSLHFNGIHHFNLPVNDSGYCRRFSTQCLWVNHGIIRHLP